MKDYHDQALFAGNALADCCYISDILETVSNLANHSQNESSRGFAADTSNRT